MIQPTKNYFLVKISKKEQQEKKESSGIFKLVLSDNDMSRNMQSGEIVAIGAKAQEAFPEAKVGQILIMHHFVEGDKSTRNDALVFEDETFRYYVVAAFAHNGKASEAFGVWTGETVIPHPEYIFLELDAPTLGQVALDKFHDEAMQVTSGGLFLFKEYKTSREEKLEKIQSLRNEILQLSKTKMNSQIKEVIEEKEREQQSISRSMNSVKFMPYTIAYSNPLLDMWFDRKVKSGDTIFVQEYAPSEVEINDKRYLVSKSEYIGWLLN